MKDAAYQLAVIIFVLTVLAGGLMVLAPAAVNADGAYAMDMQRIAWQDYQRRIDMKNLPRPEWPRPF